MKRKTPREAPESSTKAYFKRSIPIYISRSWPVDWTHAFDDFYLTKEHCQLLLRIADRRRVEDNVRQCDPLATLSTKPVRNGTSQPSVVGISNRIPHLVGIWDDYHLRLPEFTLFQRMCEGRWSVCVCCKTPSSPKGFFCWKG